MALFNSYNNKNISFLIEYINGRINDDNAAMTADELRDRLVGDSQLTYEGLIDELTNSCSDPNDDAMLFYTDDDNRLQPLRNIRIPVRTTLPERTWLYHILKDPKAGLFLDQDTIRYLQQELRNTDNSISEAKDADPAAYVLNDDTYATRDFSGSVDRGLSDTVNMYFRELYNAMLEHRYVQIDNKAKNGQFYRNEKVLPMRFEYKDDTSELSVSVLAPCVDQDGQPSSRPVLINLACITGMIPGEVADEYDEKAEEYKKAFDSKLIKDPIELHITDDKNGIDRALSILSPYPRQTYRNDDGSLTMLLRCYSFRKERLINDLLFLGTCVEVTGPDSFRADMAKAVNEALARYTQ